jgi:hypothetical protein
MRPAGGNARGFASGRRESARLRAGKRAPAGGRTRERAADLSKLGVAPPKQREVQRFSPARPGLPLPCPWPRALVARRRRCKGSPSWSHRRSSALNSWSRRPQAQGSPPPAQPLTSSRVVLPCFTTRIPPRHSFTPGAPLVSPHLPMLILCNFDFCM